MPGLTAAMTFWVISEEVRTLDAHERAQVIPAPANTTGQVTLLLLGFLCQAQRDGKGKRGARAAASQGWRPAIPCTGLQSFNLQNHSAQLLLKKDKAVQQSCGTGKLVG